MILFALWKLALSNHDFTPDRAINVSSFMLFKPYGKTKSNLKWIKLLKPVFKFCLVFFFLPELKLGLSLVHLDVIEIQIFYISKLI